MSFEATSLIIKAGIASWERFRLFLYAALTPAGINIFLLDEVGRMADFRAFLGDIIR
jgi:hypothetical protein